MGYVEEIAKDCGSDYPYDLEHSKYSMIGRRTNITTSSPIETRASPLSTLELNHQSITLTSCTPWMTPWTPSCTRRNRACAHHQQKMSQMCEFTKTLCFFILF